MPIENKKGNFMQVAFSIDSKEVDLLGSLADFVRFKEKCDLGFSCL